MSADERPIADRPGPAEKLARALGVATEPDDASEVRAEEAERPPVDDAAQADSDR